MVDRRHCENSALLELLGSLFRAACLDGIDYICVQSYDGQLSVFECEAFAFSRFLPGFLIPGTRTKIPVLTPATPAQISGTSLVHGLLFCFPRGLLMPWYAHVAQLACCPLAYIEPSDSIVTSNAALELECYKFKTLADATGEQPSPPKSKEDGGGEESQNGKSEAARLSVTCLSS
eukprot:1158705-Pelagomonas_calceolata.AAC.26